MVSISRNRLSVHLLSRNNSCANYSFHFFFNCHEAKQSQQQQKNNSRSSKWDTSLYTNMQHLSSSSSIFFVFFLVKTSRGRKKSKETKHDVNSPWKMPMQINLSQARPLGIRAWASVSMGKNKNGKSKRNWNQWIGFFCFFRYNLHNTQMHWLEFGSKQQRKRREKAIFVCAPHYSLQWTRSISSKWCKKTTTTST